MPNWRELQAEFLTSLHWWLDTSLLEDSLILTAPSLPGPACLLAARLSLGLSPAWPPHLALTTGGLTRSQLEPLVDILTSCRGLDRDTDEGYVSICDSPEAKTAASSPEV